MYQGLESGVRETGGRRVLKRGSFIALVALSSGCVVAGVALGLGRAYAGSAPPHALAGAPPPPTSSELTAIQGIALGAATSDGDPNPTNVVLVPTLRSQAELIDAGTPTNSDQAVYFVVMHGTFTAAGVPAPPGAAAPTGTVITLTIDAATNRVLDFGIEDSPPNVDRMGIPEPITLPHAVASRQP